jgi:ATP-dependent protease ClpP protease subunit
MQKLYSQIIVATIILSGCTFTRPEHVSIEQTSDSEYRFNGHLYATDYDNILSILAQHPGQELSFYITSDGGTSNHLIPLMDALYNHGKANWYVVDYCNSACAILALSTRHANGKLNLHSFYAVHHHSILMAHQFNQQVLDKLKIYGYNTEKLKPMFTTVKKMWTVTIKDGVIVNYNS